jgi:hypothetical protein
VKPSLVARGMIATTIILLAFWISAGFANGGPWDGVLLACIITVVVMFPLYWYGIWLRNRLQKSRRNREDNRA